MAMSLEPLGGGGGSGRKRMAGRFNPRAEINVTPFVDVMLVLLIVFMVTAPLLTVGELVDLPRTQSEALPADEEPLAVLVRADGSVLIQETEIALDELRPKLAALAAAGGKSLEDRIYLYGDQVTNYGDVVAVMAEITGAGFSNIALVTDPISQARPATDDDAE